MAQPKSLAQPRFPATDWPTGLSRKPIIELVDRLPPSTGVWPLGPNTGAGRWDPLTGSGRGATPPQARRAPTSRHRGWPTTSREGFFNENLETRSRGHLRVDTAWPTTRKGEVFLAGSSNPHATGRPTPPEVARPASFEPKSSRVAKVQTILRLKNI